MIVFVKTDILANMKKLIKKYDKTVKILAGLAIGLVNGFFGSGGGIIAVQAMEKMDLEQKKSHATSLLAIFPLSIASAVIYFLNGNISFDANTWFLLGGACAGGLLGALLLDKLKGEWVNGIFTLLIIASGVRMVLG